MSIRPAERTENIFYAIRNIVSHAKKLEQGGLKITYLNIGDPVAYDFDVPETLKEAACAAIKRGLNGYAHSYGMEEARRAVAKDEVRKGKPGISSDDVIITSGASEGIEMALTALLNPDENVLLPVPGYPLYEAIVGKIGAFSKGYRLDGGNGWQPDPGHLESMIDSKTRAVVIINPNNPTGSVCPGEILRGIIDLCRNRGLILLSDEIYDCLLFDGKKMLYPALYTQDVPIISFNGLSKNFIAPGWRMGWMVFQNMENEVPLISAIRRIAEARLCASTPMQAAIAPALEGDRIHLEKMLMKLTLRRDIAFERLNAIPGVRCVKPQAAFYAMPEVEGIKDDEVFVKRLVEDTGVLFVHGSGFGMRKDAGTFRLVFLPDEKTLHGAFDRFEKFLKK